IPAIYTIDHVTEVLEKILIVEYDKPFTHNNFSITYRDAGHILGSASIEVTDADGKTTVFSGDLGNTPQDIIKPTTSISNGHTAVIESTYGGETHKHEDVDEVLQHEINEVEETNGVLLIPAFSIQRTQEVIHRIGHLLQQKKIKSNTPIFVDSPMAIRVTEVFKKYRALYNEKTANEENPFEFDSLFPTPGAHESKDILKTDGPKVIIAGSGMMNGGRIHYHLKNYISSHNTRLLIVGYQAQGTLGRQIEQGVRRIVLFEEEIAVNASITKIESMSSHADHPKLMNWLKSIEGLTTVCIVHGEQDRREALEKAIKTDFPTMAVHLPTKDQTIELQ
ncbi:MAG TPA: MBL fold metallo-hydrolase, partial [Candidatus Levybacteria bacterium]|nr:MBL fold metallo-hydrolase [Candidatus Levybacteria bacterium]